MFQTKKKHPGFENRGALRLWERSEIYFPSPRFLHTYSKVIERWECTWKRTRRCALAGIHRDLSFFEFARERQRRMTRCEDRNIRWHKLKHAYTDKLTDIHTCAHTQTNGNTHILKSNFAYELGATHHIWAWVSKRGYVRARVRKTGASVLAFWVSSTEIAW